MTQQGPDFYDNLDVFANYWVSRARPGKALARNNNSKVTVLRQSLETLQLKPNEFDIVISSLVFHYIDDLAAFLRRVSTTLKLGGRLVFSVEHPVITSCYRSLENSSLRQDWIVDDYFMTGARQNNWMGGQVMKYHRTIEDYLRILLDSGFTFEALRESNPTSDAIADAELLRRRQRIPLFLFLAGRKL